MRVTDGSDQLDPLLRRAEVLFLAGRDLWDVGVCVDYLLNATTAAQLPSRIRHTLEVGAIVTYCRPFNGRSGRTITVAADLPRDLLDFHHEIMKRRNVVYAHTDYTEHRRARNFRSRAEALELLRNFDTGVVHEEWDSLTDNGLTCLRLLAAHHHHRVADELDRLKARFDSQELHRARLVGD
jgi:hypothetical protein